MGTLTGSDPGDWEQYTLTALEGGKCYLRDDEHSGPGARKPTVYNDMKNDLEKTKFQYIAKKAFSFVCNNKIDYPPKGKF